MFKLPKLFFKPQDNTSKVIEMKSYYFILPNKYNRNPEKQTEFNDKNNPHNIITLGVKEPMPIDFLDKMGDKDRDLKVMCESVADDFLKNAAAGGGDEEAAGTVPTAAVRFMVSSKPYIRKNNIISDKAVN